MVEEESAERDICNWMAECGNMLQWEVVGYYVGDPNENS